MKRLLGQNLPAIVQEQTHSNAPADRDQMAVITQRRGGQDAVNRLLVRQTDTADLAFDDPMKVMHVQIFVAFTFGVPQDRNFDALKFFDRNTPDLPRRGQLTTGAVDTVFTA